jgi:predicted MFS family arabinose efflux permease
MSRLFNHAALEPFRTRAYRYQWSGDLLTSWAFEMENLILGWYILVSTGSVLFLAVFSALQYLGTLISPLFGVASDRAGPRNVLCGMRIAYTLLAFVLLVLASQNAVSPTVVLVIAGASGLIRPSDLAMRNALISYVLPSSQLMAAVSITRTTSDSARIVGTLAGAGLVIWLGMTSAYVIVVSFYLGGLILTWMVQVAPDMAPRTLRASPLRDLGAGLGYVWTSPRLLALMWLAFLVNLTAYPVTNGLMAYVAKEVMHVDQAWFSYLMASYALGSLTGAISLSVVGNRVPLEALTFIGTAMWYVFLLVFAQEHNPYVALLILAAVGVCQNLAMLPLFVILLNTSQPQFRGRVMGVRMLAIYGLPLGLVGAGWLVERIGFGMTQTMFALVGLAMTLAIGLRWRSDLWQERAVAR